MDEMHGVVWLHGDWVQEEAAVMCSVGQGRLSFLRAEIFSCPTSITKFFPCHF